ncbi:30S ribosomal protein S11 [Candidatus Peregrinibacteria bacterium]|nr:30S ribosomal protein S11 [Candidatus Peregrinibacteria bacterium]
MAEKTKSKEKEVKKPTEKAAEKETGKNAGKTAEENTGKGKTSTKTAKKSKAKRRIVQVGRAYIQASFNNTIVTLTEPNGNVITTSSAGSSGFKGARKATPYAAQVAAENAAEKAKVFGLEKVHIFVKGVGSGREQAIRGLSSKGIDIISINDVTPLPHNGCRKKKGRRV